MLFNSLVFLFVFLPIVLLLYYLMPVKVRNYILLIGSLVFYSWGGVKYALILVISIIFNYLFVTQIRKKDRFGKFWLSIGLISNVSLIVVFKYLDFFIENFNFLGMVFWDNFKVIPLAHIVLPLGISFFTFQQMSMLWDVYRSEEKRKIGFLETSLYISFFPQLIAGPIVRYNDIIDQIHNRKESLKLFQ